MVWDRIVRTAWLTQSIFWGELQTFPPKGKSTQTFVNTYESATGDSSLHLHTHTVGSANLKFIPMSVCYYISANTQLPTSLPWQLVAEEVTLMHKP